MISCLLFDLDGTLFDQYEANGKAYAAAFERVGLHFDNEKYQKAYGLRFAELMEQLAPDTDETLYPQIKELKDAYYKEHFHLVRPNHGLLELLKSMDSTYKTALVTTARKNNVMNLLKHFSIDPSVFNVIITGEDVAHSKPDPECYLLAMKRLGKKPQECLIFEDSVVGIQAAEKAGAYVVRVKL